MKLLNFTIIKLTICLVIGIILSHYATIDFQTVLYGTITLSKPLCLLNDETQVRDTILHEIAHALTLGHGHDNTWKRKCVEIGAKPIRCYSSDEVTRPKMKYVAICGGCQREFQKGRITRKARYSKQSCKCQAGKSWDDRHILVFKERSL